MSKFIKCAGVLLLSACMGLTSYGKAVDENTAKTIGCNFLRSTYEGIISGPADLVTAYIATDQANFGIITDYYVFNVQGGIGFVMVSGDDNIQPIIAYSNESSFDFSNISPNAKFWIEGYKDEITKAIANKLPAKEGVAQMWADLMVAKKNHPSEAKTTGMFPSSSVYLLKTKWDQEPGYNLYCPSGTPTGCVATSTAQVMKFWNWPAVGSGYHKYTSKTLGAVLSADFSNTAYNWAGWPSSMSNSLLASNKAVDSLMFQVGVAVNMDYTTSASGSGAYTLITDANQAGLVNCSEYALKTYFHYKRSIHGVNRYKGQPDQVPDATWTGLLMNELDAGRPILYSGDGSGGGHAWVCDGYSSSSMFHMNWGWSGNGPDGYYAVGTVDDLNPPSLGAGGGAGAFNSNQGIIIGIQPDSFPSTPSGPLELKAHLDCGTSFNSPANYLVNAFSITTQIGNTGSAAFAGDFSAQLFDTNMVYFATMQTLAGQNITAAGTTPALTFTNSVPMYQMIPGTYNVRIMYRPTGTSTWSPVANNGTFINDNVLVVGNSQSLELATATVVKTNGVVTPTTLTKGQPAQISASIQNFLSGNFNGSVQAVLTDVVSGTQYIIQTLTSQTIFFSATSPFSFSTTSLTAPGGTYTLSIQHKSTSAPVDPSFVYTGSDVYQNPIIITVNNGVGINTPSVAAEKITVFPNPAKDVININMDGVVVSQVTITDIHGRQLQKLTPDNNQSVMTLPVNNYAAGIYFVNLFTGSEVVTKKIVITK